MATDPASLTQPQIAPVLPEDFEQVYQIEQQAHVIPWSLGTLKNNQGERYLNLKLCVNQKIIGFAICQHVLDEATLFNIAIDPTHQQQGYGKLLLKAVIEQLQQLKIQCLWLEVRASNLSAQKLYQQLGFNEVDRRKNYYPTPDGSHEDALLMALYL